EAGDLVLERREIGARLYEFTQAISSAPASRSRSRARLRPARITGRRVSRPSTPLFATHGLGQDATSGGTIMSDPADQRLPFGADDRRLPDPVRGPLRAPLAALRERYRRRGWGGPVGFGGRPALIVVDLALAWTDPTRPAVGSTVDSVVEATARVLAAARTA